jgi:hypothetical protein
MPVAGNFDNVRKQKTNKRSTHVCWQMSKAIDDSAQDMLVQQSMVLFLKALPKRAALTA